MEWARDCLHLRQTTDHHVPEVEVQVKHRIALLNNQEWQLGPRQSQQQQGIVDFQVEPRQAFLVETPRGIKAVLEHQGS
ncbi:SNRPN upstream reading frame protein-like [Rhinolophus ferrumequinum]|uniref:Uncharacterized protein n=1 Tax=Rhinolophus ferrumequinum TaxID=59479 RepID=A0A671E4Z4_RHIFE|nr:SNRPN upstream reading frame protein-like [Rhinolophus ferrumequinum]